MLLMLQIVSLAKMKEKILSGNKKLQKKKNYQNTLTEANFNAFWSTDTFLNHVAYFTFSNLLFCNLIFD